MTKTYTVTFAGHRKLLNHEEISQQLETILRQVLCEHEYVEFLIGHDGDFDRLAASCVKRLQKDGYRSLCTLVLVLPYNKKDIVFFEKFYDEIEICEEASHAHFKAAITIRNRHMVDRCHLVVSYVKGNGGAQTTLHYAEKTGKTIINLAQI